MDVLRILAVSRSSGALEIRGTRPGVFFLHEGDITYAEVLPAQTSQTGPGKTIHAAIVDAAAILLAVDGGSSERPLFRPGRRHWSGTICRLPVETMLAEIEQRRASAVGPRVEPDDEVQLCSLLPGRSVVLTRQQWALVTGMSARLPVRSLVVDPGLPLATVIADVSSLVAAGVVVRSARTGSVAGPVARQPARPPVRPPAQQPERVSERAPERMPRRVRGATRLPPAPPQAGSSMPSRSLVSQPGMMDDGHAIALRLLEGLRRL